MQRVFAKYVILFISIQLMLSKCFSENVMYPWQCYNGQVISDVQLCDGKYDCADGSDESIEECLLQPCPRYAFRCAYGACISGNFKCNGVVNCVDGSDETRYLCEPNLDYNLDVQGRCVVPDSIECKSMECISDLKLCDGQIDCMDGSDETVEICSSIECPHYAFHCGYGACISGSARCDGIKDCRDGSDEIASMCSNSTRKTTTTIKPIQEVTSISSWPAILTTDSMLPIPTSKNKCSAEILKRGISSVSSCYYQNQELNCFQDLPPGTIVNVSCAPGYVENQKQKFVPSLKCDEDGEWTDPKRKCTPECGVLTDEQKNFVSKPWDVTILRRDYAPIYMTLCSGVIVSPKIVLTAANCFLSYNNAYYTDHIFYNVIEGFYNKSYHIGDLIDARVHNISSISIKDMDSTQDLAILVVASYFKFSYNLKPICLPTSQGGIFPLYTDKHLNIGRPILRDATRIYLEYLIASIANNSSGHITLTYVNIYHFLPYVQHELKRYAYIL